jgi:hypothetical protein
MRQQLRPLKDMQKSNFLLLDLRRSELHIPTERAEYSSENIPVFINYAYQVYVIVKYIRFKVNYSTFDKWNDSKKLLSIILSVLLNIVLYWIIIKLYKYLIKVVMYLLW